MRLFGKKRLEWCCRYFEMNYLKAGNRGFAAVVRKSIGGDGYLFTIQHRSLDPEAPHPPLQPGVPFSLISEMVIGFCPWCGKDLHRWYAPWMTDLLRPEFEMKLS